MHNHLLLGNKKHATYLSDYKHKISVKLAMTLKKFLRDLKKSVAIINEQDDVILLFNYRKKN